MSKKEVFPRLEIATFVQDKRRLSLFLRAWRKIQDRPAGDVLSFEEIGGIHGLPYKAYDGVTGDDPYASSDPYSATGGEADRWGGYCQHGTPLFPTWHRPYVMLIERAIRTDAQTVLEETESAMLGSIFDSAKASDVLTELKSDTIPEIEAALSAHAPEDDKAIFTFEIANYEYTDPIEGVDPFRHFADAQAAASNNDATTGITYSEDTNTYVLCGGSQKPNNKASAWKKISFAGKVIEVAKELFAWRKAYKELRFPYWDWAALEVQGDLEVNGAPTPLYIPSVFSSTSFDTVYSVPTLIRNYTNPLFSYPLKHSVDDESSIGVLTYTWRYYMANSDKGLQNWNYWMKKYQEHVLKPGVWHMFNTPDWEHFSNHYSPAHDKEERGEYGNYASIEVVHDAVHDAIGGGGPMSIPSVAGLDPIFFIHHASVDRLLALWQKLHPDEWIPTAEYYIDGTFTEESSKQENKDEELGADTPLTPFRVDGAGDDIYTSNMVRHIEDHGYTYPELIDSELKTPEELRAFVKGLYDPGAHASGRFVLRLDKIEKRVLDGPYTIHVFLGNSEDIPQDISIWNKRQAGSIYVFARSQRDPCKTCGKTEYMQGQVDLTTTMTRLNMDVDPEDFQANPGPEEETEQGAQLLKGLVWILITQFKHGRQNRYKMESANLDPNLTIQVTGNVVDNKDFVSSSVLAQDVVRS